MSALRQLVPQAVQLYNQTLNTISKKNLSSLGNDSLLSRYIQEPASISSHLSLGNSNYQNLKSQSQRLILDDIDEIYATFGGCDCCQAEGAHDMRREIDDIVRRDRAQANQR